VKGGQAPKDTVFGLKDVRIERGPGKGGEGVPGAGVPRATRPKEGAFSAGDIRFSQAEKARDLLFTSTEIQVKEKGIRPSDTSLLTLGKGKVPAAVQPKELDPGRRGIGVINPSAAEKQTGKPERKPRSRNKKDDEEIGWIH
jgi:hypothetical protein